MANGRRGFFRDIILRLDREAARQVREDTEDALEAAGQAGAAALEEAMQAGGNKAVRALTRELSRGYNQTIAEARVKFAQGLIPASEFQRIRAEAAATFDRGLIAGMERLRGEGKLNEAQFVRLARSLKSTGQQGERDIGLIQRALEKVRAVSLSVGGALAGLFALNKIRSFIQGSTQLAARYETLGVVLHQVGQNAGYSADELDRASASLQKAGISMLESRSTAAQLISAQIDLAHATRLARIAQDAAVIGNINSSEAFQRLINGIASAQVQTLRNIGLNVNFTRSYQVLAAQLGKTVEQLTEAEKVQARTNAVLEQGTAIAGTYEKSLDTAGKQIGSNTRLLEDLRIKLGQVFLPSFRNAVFAYSDALKAAHTWIDRLEKSKIEEWGRRVARAVDILVGTVRELVVRVQALTKALLVTGLVLGLNRLRTAIIAANTAAITFRATLQGFYALMGPKGWLILGVAALTEAFHRSGQRAREAKAEIDGYFASLRAMTVEELTAEITALGKQRRELEAQIARTSAGPRRRRLEENLELVRQAGLEAIRLRNELIRAAREPAEVATETAAETADELSADELAKEITALRRGHDLRVLTAQERARALELERQITRQLRDGTLSLEDRIKLAQQLQALQEITPQVKPPRMADTMGVLPGLAPIPLEPIRDARVEVDALAQRWLALNADMVGAAERAAMGITGAFQDAFGALIEDFGNVGEAAEAMARGVAGALVGGVADYASSKVSENVALAIEASARALAAASNPFTARLAPGFWAAAKTHALAAAKWAVLAGAAGAGQAAIAGGGRGGLSGGVPTGARDPTGRLLEERRGPEVHIYIDPLDPANPAWQRSVYAAQRYAQQRYGDGATVHVHPRTGGAR